MKKAVVVGGSRGLGLGMVDALRAQGTQVCVVSRESASEVLARERPDVLIVNAGAKPEMGPIKELTWERFSNTWNVDVRIAFEWVQAALRLPLARGARVLLTSSGAAVKGSPLSGGYAGAKRMVWLLAQYANKEGAELGIRFQTLLPMALIRGTGVGDTGARGYAKDVEAFWASYTPKLTPNDIGEAALQILRADGIAYAVKDGITCIDE